MMSQETAGFQKPLCLGTHCLQLQRDLSVPLNCSAILEPSTLPFPPPLSFLACSNGFPGMTRLLLLGLLTSLTSVVVGKIFGRCELAQKLKAAGLDGYRGYSLENWICLAFYESHFDTGLVDHEADGSTSNGIFQINSHIWCDDLVHPSPNICELHCSDLLTSNINDDITCAMRIVQTPRGMGTWMAWRNNCEGLDLSHWLKGCVL